MLAISRTAVTGETVAGTAVIGAHRAVDWIQAANTGFVVIAQDTQVVGAWFEAATHGGGRVVRRVPQAEKVTDLVGEYRGHIDALDRCRPIDVRARAIELHVDVANFPRARQKPDCGERVGIDGVSCRPFVVLEQKDVGVAVCAVVLSLAAASRT